MGTSTFQSGSFVVIQQKTFRLLRQVDDQIWQLEEERTKRIHEYSLSQMQSLYAAGQLVFANPANDTSARNSSSRAEILHLGKDFEVAKVRRTYAMAVMDVANTPEALNEAIDEVWARLNKPDKLNCHGFARHSRVSQNTAFQNLPGIAFR